MRGCNFAFLGQKLDLTLLDNGTGYRPECIFWLSESRETVKGMAEPNAHVIGFNEFDMPLSRPARPNTHDGRLVIGCVGGVVASMIMVTSISQKNHPVTD